MEFFAVSKIFWIVAAPANLMGLCFLAGMVFKLSKSWRLSNFFLTCGFLLFLIFGVLPTGPSLLAWLETRYDRPATLPDNVSGIIVLGGAFDTYLSGIHGFPVLNDGVDRVLDGIRLAEKYPGAEILFSGGNGRLVNRKRSEATDVADFLKDYPAIAERAAYEGKSRNTLQNAAFSLDQVKPAPGETWVLVTSAYHMPRAVAVFRAVGWPRIVPWPTDYRTNGKVDMMPHRLDILGNLYMSHLATRELIGRAVYRIRYKI